MPSAAERAAELLCRDKWYGGVNYRSLTPEGKAWYQRQIAALYADPDLLREMADEAKGETHFVVTEGQAVLDGAVWDIEYGEAVRNAEERSDVLTGLVLVVPREAPDA